jgi:hypothetical protein
MVDVEFLFLGFGLTWPHSAKLVVAVAEVVVLLGVDRLELRCRQSLRRVGGRMVYWKEWMQIMKHEKLRNQQDWLGYRDNSEWKLQDHRHLLTLGQQR